MTIEKWLSDVYQDSYVGNKIWNKTIDGGSEMIADIRGWGALQYKFKTNEDAKSFQSEVCKFIVDAIREKIANNTQTEKKYSKEEVIAFTQWMYDYKGDINKVEEILNQLQKK